MGRDPFTAALRYLLRSPRSRLELERFLEREGVSPEERTAWLERMASLGYLDDGALGRREAARLASRYGQRAIRQRLQARGLALGEEEAIHLEEGEAERALALLERWLRQEGGPPSNRLAARLLRRGFSMSAVRRAFDRQKTATKDGLYIDRHDQDF